LGFGFIFFVKTDGEIATGHAKRVEEVRIAAVVVVRIVHGSNLPQITDMARIF
jgi:hypothetical protein